jgi:hypothetical protein
VDVEHDRVSADRKKSGQPSDQAGRDKDARHCTKQKQQTGFHQQLPQQPPCASASREPDRKLARARGAAREQQIAQVDARDEEDNGGDERERVQRLRETRAQPVGTTSRGHQLDTRKVFCSHLVRLNAGTHE